MPDGDHTQTARNERLVHARTSLHWSQAETARRLGVATTTYARWERGEQRPHPGQVRRLEVIFDRPAEDLGFGHASLAEPELAAASAVAAPVEQQFDRLIDQVRDRWARLLQRRIREIGLTLALRPSAVQDPSDIYASSGQADIQLPADTSIDAVYDDCGGRLLILGEPGAGKSAYLGDLLYRLLDTATPGPRRAPVLFHLSLWESGEHDLDRWLVGQLRDRYGVAEALGSRWLEQERIIPLLDGLDTVPANRRDACCRAIDEFLVRRRDLPVVVVSRAHEFETLSQPLALRTAVVVHPAPRAALERYLADPGMARVRDLAEEDPALWDLLATPLFLDFVARTYGESGTEQPPLRGSVGELRGRILDDYVRHQLARPTLRGVSAPHDPAANLRWLVSLAQGMLPERLLFLDWIQTRWLPSRPMRELVYLAPSLAVALFGAVIGTLLMLSASLFLLAAGAIRGVHLTYVINVAIGSHGGEFTIVLPDQLGTAVTLGMVSGLLVGSGAGAVAYQRFIAPTDQIEWSWPELRYNMPRALTAVTAATLLAALLDLAVSGLVVMLLFLTGLAAIFTLLAYEGPSGELAGGAYPPLRRRWWLAPIVVLSLLGTLLLAADRFDLVQGKAASGLGYQVAVGVAVGLSVVVGFGFRAQRYDWPTPGTRMEVSRRNAVRAAVTGVLLAGIPLGLLDGIRSATLSGITAGLVAGPIDALSFGLGMGLAAGMRRGGAAWLRHRLLLRLLVAHGLLPGDLGPFLDEMCRRVLLLHVGDGYRFYHDVLQDHLATMTPGELDRLAATLTRTVS